MKVVSFLMVLAIISITVACQQQNSAIRAMGTITAGGIEKDQNGNTSPQTQQAIATAVAVMAENTLRELAPTLSTPIPATTPGTIVISDFESQTVSGSYTSFGQGKVVDGWIIESGSVDLIGSHWQSFSGKQSLDLNGRDAGTIYRDFPTLPGIRYVVRLLYAGNGGAAPPVKRFEVWWNNQKDELSFDTQGKSHSNMGWVLYQVTNTATGNSTRLKLVSKTTGSSGPAIDKVEVIQESTLTPTPIPQPTARLNVPVGNVAVGGELQLPILLTPPKTGLSTYKLTIKVDPQVEIESVELPDGLGSKDKISPQEIRIEFEDILGVVFTPNMQQENVALAELTIKGKASGTSTVAVTVNQILDDSRKAVAVTVVPGTIAVR